MLNKSFYKLRPLFSSAVLLLMIFAAFISVSAKANTADSLKTILPKVEGIEKAKTLIEILEFYHNVNSDSAHFYSNELSAISEKLNYRKGKLAALAGALNVDFIRGNYTQCIEKAIPHLQESYENPDYHVANMYLSAGNCYGSLGLYKAGVELYLRAKSIFLPLNEIDRLKTIDNNLGAYYIRMGDYKLAEPIIKSLVPSSKDDPTHITKAVNLGFINLGLKKYEEAKKYFERVLEFGDSSIELRGKAISSYKLGDLYNEINVHESAIKYYNKSLGYYSDIENIAQTINPLIGLASCNLKMNNFEEAEKYALKAEALGDNSSTLHELVNATTILSEIYSSKKDFENAYKYAHKSKVLSDSLNVSRKNQEIQLLETDFEFKLREEEIRRVQESELRQQKLYLFIVAGILLASLIFGFVIFRSKKQQDEANKKLENVNAELEETNQIKDQLFSIIAHDLRNPLSSLYGMVTLLEMKSSDKEEVEKLIPDLVDQFKHTSNLLNNLLNWSKSQMDGYKVLKEVFDVNAVFDENIELLKSRFEEKGISVTLDKTTPDLVFADRNMIHLVVLNLLSNAAKYSDKGDSVTISKSLIENELKISVRDTGVGIPDEKIETLFEKSFFTTSGTRDEKGTGLGLMLCKTFIEKNDGKIWVESQTGDGSTFHFTLPIPPKTDS